MTNRNSLLLLMLMVVFSPLAIDIFLPALPVMAQDFSASMTQMQWSISVFLLSLGVGQLLCGPLADRYGRRPVAIGGVIIYGVSSILLSFTDSLVLFLICRMVQGVGACAIFVAAFASVRDRYDPIQSGVIYSYLNSITCCVPALAPLLGHMLMEHFGWRSNFEIMALYAICAGAVIAIAFPETRPSVDVQHQKLITLGRFLPILKSPVFLFNSVVVMLSMTIILAFVSSSPAWLMIQLGESQQGFVFWFSLNAAVNVVAYWAAPKVLIKLGPRFTIGMGMVIVLVAGLMMLLLREWTHPIAFMLPVIISSLGISLLMGPCAGQALSPFGDIAGTASALLGFIQMSGAALVVLLLQFLPISVPEQLALLMVTFVPVYWLWKRPGLTTRLYNIPVEPVGR